MSVSLVVIRLETTTDFPQLQHIQYQARSEPPSSKGRASSDCDVEVQPSEWPLLVSDTLLAMHRGQRHPAQITITTLNTAFIEKEMAAFERAGCRTAEDVKQQQQLDDGSPCTDETSVVNNDVSGEQQSDGDCSATEGKDEDSVSALPTRWSSKESTPAASSSKEGTPGPSDDVSQASSSSSSSSKRTSHRIPFLSGNPTVDVTHGILHLYKQNTKTSLSQGEERSSMVCLLSVPCTVTIHDLLQFTAPCYSGMLHLRIIRDSSPSQYMVLVRFRSQSEADEFYNNFNDRPFNSLEPDVVCRLVYVTRVETTTDTKDGGLPIPGHSELPTCPVCLERMDESVDGVLTILCNHSFHGECLAKWGDTSCPVCRYCQTVEAAEDQVCSQCGARDSLWICLICGHVGCGRYVGGHAHRHFVETNHLFSMQLGNNRVWDYVRDNYVHRLLQSEGDGKVVSYERGGGGDGELCGGGDDAACTAVDIHTKEQQFAGEEKLSTLQLEYTHLLSSQLESQRQYFEDRMAELATVASNESEERRAATRQLEGDMTDLRRQVTALTRDKQGTDKKIAQLIAKLNKVHSDLETEQHLNLNLRQSKQELLASIEELKKQLLGKDATLVDLEGQVRDLLVHLDAASSVASNPELQGASIALPQQQQQSARARGRRRR
uniref:BRCA1-associated protein-like n=3 Tax=Hirondellea gigas TaxID=1518452 RepID=A0A6A7G106_9CRUS